jgi:L-fuculose-phosphate aldolase
MRSTLLKSFQTLQKLGLNRGTSGNASVRIGENFLITPSGMDLESMSENSMVEMSMSGEPLTAGKPSSEWRFHRDIYQVRPEVSAIVHTHSMFATSLSCLRRDIPPFHYMIALAGGDTIRCAEYALFGTQALSDAAIIALQDRRACLLANHGMIAVGKTLKQAVDIALEVETLCEQYWRALQVGEPQLLSPQEMEEVFEQFKGYGNWNK